MTDSASALPAQDTAAGRENEETAAPAGPGAARKVGLLAGLTLGHVLNDFYATLFQPLLAEIGRTFSLSLAQAQFLPLVTGVFGSVVQPVVGALGDRFGRKRFVVAGTAGAAVFMCAIGYAHSLPALFALLVAASAGVSAFHPNGAALAASYSLRRGFSFAVFLTGGAVGLALAPAAATRIYAHTRDLRSLIWLAIPGAALAAALAVALPADHAAGGQRPRADYRELFGRGAGRLWVFFVVVTLRSIVFAAFASLVSYLALQRGWTMEQRGFAASGFMASSAVGAAFGGWMSDWTDRKALMLVSCFLGAPLLAAFAFASEFGHALGWLLSAGAVVSLATPMMVVIAQELCPTNQSAASGLMMGLAWGLASLALPLVGLLAQIESVRPSGALAVISSLTALAGVIVLFMPSFDSHLRGEAGRPSAAGPTRE